MQQKTNSKQRKVFIRNLCKTFKDMVEKDTLQQNKIQTLKRLCNTYKR